MMTRTLGLTHNPAFSLRNTQFDAVEGRVRAEEAVQSRQQYSQFRNMVLKDYRKTQSSLVNSLDMALPPNRRSKAKRAQAPGRGLGTGGRSLNLVLEDTVAYLRERRSAEMLSCVLGSGNGPPSLLGAQVVTADSHQKVHGDGSYAAQISFTPQAKDSGGAEAVVVNTMHHESLMSSRSFFVIEVENRWTWTITEAGQGAVEFFRDAPFGNIVGQSLANLVRCEELPLMHQAWRQGEERESHGKKRKLQDADAGFQLHIIDFSARGHDNINMAADEIADVLSRDPLEWESKMGSNASRSVHHNVISSQTAAGAPAAEADFDVLLRPPSQYSKLKVHLVLLPARDGVSRPNSSAPLSSRSSEHVGKRALLLGVFQGTTVLPTCSICEMPCCFRTQHNYPTEVVCQVQRPVYRAIQFQKVSHTQDQIWDKYIGSNFGWSQLAMNRVWTYGISREFYAELFGNLPPALLSVFKNICMSTEVLIAYKKSQLSKAVALQSYQLSSAGGGDVLDEDDFDPDNELKEGQNAWRTVFDPLTGMRTGFQITKGMSALLQCGYEETCVRLRRCELKPFWNHLEMIAFICDSILEAFGNVLEQTRYCRTWTPGQGQGFLFRFDVTWKSDVLGRRLMNRYVFSQITADEYDRALRETPEQCRPFLGPKGMCDMRSGRQLIESAEHDYYAHSLQELSKTEAGREYLNRYAALIAGAMTPVFGAAQSIMAGMRAAQEAHMAAASSASGRA